MLLTFAERDAKIIVTPAWMAKEGLWHFLRRYSGPTPRLLKRITRKFQTFSISLDPEKLRDAKSVDDVSALIAGAMDKMIAALPLVVASAELPLDMASAMAARVSSDGFSLRYLSQYRAVENDWVARYDMLVRP